MICILTALQQNAVIDFLFISIPSRMQRDEGQCVKERAGVRGGCQGPDNLCVNPMLTGLESDHIVQQSFCGTHGSHGQQVM